MDASLGMWMVLIGLDELAFCCGAVWERTSLMLPNPTLESNPISCCRAPRQQQRLG
jgi:hypothetical protein